MTGSGYDSFVCSSPAAGGYISLIQADLGSGGDPVYALFRPYGAAGNGDADPLLQCSWLRGIRFDRAFHRAIRGDDRSQAGGGNGKLSRFLPAGARLLGAGLRHPGASRRRGICTDRAVRPNPLRLCGGGENQSSRRVLAKCGFLQEEQRSYNDLPGGLCVYRMRLSGGEREFPHV